MFFTDGSFTLDGTGNQSTANARLKMSDRN